MFLQSFVVIFLWLVILIVLLTVNKITYFKFFSLFSFLFFSRSRYLQVKVKFTPIGRSHPSLLDLNIQPRLIFRFPLLRFPRLGITIVVANAALLQALVLALLSRNGNSARSDHSLPSSLWSHAAASLTLSRSLLSAPRTHRSLNDCVNLCKIATATSR